MRRVFATSVIGLGLLIAMGLVAITLPRLAGGSSSLDLGFFVFLFAGLWLYWALGTLIVLRADGHIVGWLFAVAAAMMAWVFGCYGIGALLQMSQPPDPLGSWFGLVGALLFPVALILILPAVALTFPTGTLPGPRWRWPVRLVAALVGVRLLAILIRPGPMSDGGLDNPLTPWLPAVSPNALEILGALEAIGFLSLPLGAGLGIAAMVVRFRRSHGDERQQLKWFLTAMAPAAVLLPASLSELGTLFPIVNLLSVAALPILGISVAIAILRYRLYDIDRLISRTISYGLITGLLVLVFLVANLGLQWLLSFMTSGNSLAVAGSTLLAAALFTTVRARVQRFVDRRFDRARYDAERTASAFSVRMRDATDLGAVTHDLDATVRRAIAPSRMGLWLRGVSRGSSSAGQGTRSDGAWC
jgi:MFS family permease